MPQLIICGFGGHARVAADIAELRGWGDIKYLDDYADNTSVVGRISDLDVYLGHPRIFIFVGIGHSSLRQSLIERVLEKCDASYLPTLVHPSAVLARTAKIGPGSLLAAGAIVNPNAVVGMGAILNTASSIDHDCVLGNFVHVSPGARLAGGVTVGDRSWIGIGSAIREGVVVGKDVIIGAGSAVIDEIPDGQTAVGLPAKLKGKANA